MTNQQIINHYKEIAEFLASCFADNCEIVIHECTDHNNSVVAIYNGDVSGREVGAPATDFALEIIQNKLYEKKSYIANYKTVTKYGKRLRSATFFIKNLQGELIGLMCVNIDVTMFEETTRLLTRIMKGPSEVPTSGTVESSVPSQDGIETFSSSVEEMIESILDKASPTMPVDRLNSEEKMEIVKLLNEKGIFILKGGVAAAAKALGISEATVYRYLTKLKNAGN